MTYSLTEPQPLLHPQASKETGYMRIGRGGRGNWIKPASQPGPAAAASKATSTSKPQQPQPSTTPALPKPTPPSSHQQAVPKYTSGRGGIGNAHTGERPMFFFDEELERIYSREGRTPPVYHIGRAGFGNRVGSVSSAAKAERVVRAEEEQEEEYRVSQDSRRSWASGSSDGRRRSSADRDRDHPREHTGVWGRLSHTFSRAS